MGMGVVPLQRVCRSSGSLGDVAEDESSLDVDVRIVSHLQGVLDLPEGGFLLHALEHGVVRALEAIAYAYAAGLLHGPQHLDIYVVHSQLERPCNVVWDYPATEVVHALFSRGEQL